MRKKLGTRFPASRIKKIMQADEDVGKIAMAVPLLVSKALELFLQDLCDRTYEITLQRGAKTLNSSHLKQCVKTYSAYDFLTGVVNKVPNLGGMEPSEDDKGIGRRRKTHTHGDEAENGEDLQLRAAKMATRNANVNPRGRGRGRGRGRPPSKPREERYVKCEDDDIMLGDQDEEAPVEQPEQSQGVEKQNNPVGIHPSSISISTIGGAATSAAAETTKTDETPGWPLPDGVGSIGIEPSRLVQLTMQIDNDDEDYDNED
ncbi:dr1-associated corepressor-like [Zingiber officinale]|uniref:NFY protein n=1 Tax=Zingiber officinale TaxID=94328 RepID=A0AA50C9V7_ZINOF|nr:dr1-associated corepressor-like [Zingiber officinale]XP_042391409.1 dr1-associated corepressor-like [Zingiber officinale]WLQ69718.1 NFY protein [Zingiber officinale]